MASRKSRSPEIIILSDSSDERKRTSKRPETINISSSSSNTKRSRESHKAASARPVSPRAASPRPEEITQKSQLNYLRQTGTHEQVEDFKDIDVDGGCFYFIELHESGVVLSCGSVLAKAVKQSNHFHFYMKFIFRDGQWISDKGAIEKRNVDSVFKCEFIGRGSAPAPNSVRTHPSERHPGLMNSFLYPPPIEVYIRKKRVPPVAKPPSPRRPTAAEEITLKSQTNYLRQTGTHEQLEDFEDIDDDGGCFYIIERNHSGLVLSCGSVLAAPTRSNVLHFYMKFIFQDGQWISNKSAIEKRDVETVFKCEFIGRGSAPAPNSVRTYASQKHPGQMNSFLYPPPIQVFVSKKYVPPPIPKRPTPKPPSPKRATRKRERPFPSSFNFDAIDPTVQRYFDMDLTVATQAEHNRLRKATAGTRHAISERFSEWLFDWVYYKAKRKDFNIDLDNGGEDINYDITLENVINVACDEINKPHKKKIWLEELIEFLYHKSYWARMDRDFLYSPINHFFKISHYEAESWGEADPGSYGPSQAATTRGPDIDGAYRILGIPPGSPFDVAKHAYRKLALKHHPDKGGDPEKFKELNEAWSNIQSSFE